MTRAGLVLAAVVCVLRVACGGAHADTPPTPEQIEALREAALASPGLDDAQKQQVTQAYDAAAGYARQAQEHADQAAAYREEIDTAQATHRRLEDALAQPPPDVQAMVNAELPADAGVDQLQPQVAAIQSEFAAQQAKVRALSQELDAQTRRPELARAELAAAQAELAGLKPATAAGGDTLAQAQAYAVAAHRRALQARIAALELELLSHTNRVRTLTLERDLQARLAEQQQERVRRWEEALSQARRAEARREQAQAAQTAEAVADQHPLLQAAAQENAALAGELAAIAPRLDHFAQRSREAAEQAAQVQQYFDAAKQMLSEIGLSDALGRVLRSQRDRLPSLARYRHEAADLRQELRRLELAVYEGGQGLDALRDPEAAARQRLRDHPQPVPADQAPALLASLTDLLDDQRDLRQRLIESQRQAILAVGELDYQQRQLLKSATAFREFLDERLLWTPSTGMIGPATLRGVLDAAMALLHGPTWATLGRDLAHGAAFRPLAVMLWLGVLIALWRVRPRLKDKLHIIAQQVGVYWADRFTLTLTAMGCVVMLALPWPWVLAGLGAMLGAAPEAGDVTRAVGEGLRAAGLVDLLIRFGMRMLRPGGVASVHFRWREQGTAVVRRALRRVHAVQVVGVFVLVAVMHDGDEAYRDSVGRLALAVVLGALGWFAWRVLQLPGGAFDEAIRRTTWRWLVRLRLVWYPLAVGLPVVVAVLALAGYVDTAWVLLSKIRLTLRVVVAGLLGHALLLRWQWLAQAKLAVQRAMETREADQAAGQAVGSDAGGDARPTSLDLPRIDLSQVNEQTRRLIRAGVTLASLLALSMVWDDLLPALRFLENIRLWPPGFTHAAAVADAGPDAALDPGLAGLTLGAVLWAGFVALLTWVAAVNVPGLLEISLLNRLGLDAGLRYAVTTLVRYAIITVGILWVSQHLGIAWDRVQWLVAALGVGLGFGLQEIFANFVSGIIILFERPVRIGDVVTLNNVTGTVSRMRIRATTVTDWDNKEIIIPNKAFVTDQLINWSLSDSVTRVIVPVGVAYETEPAKVVSLLLKVAADNDRVLATPAPVAIMTGFGDSTLNFELRVFTAELSNRLVLAHELFMAIEAACRDAGISIAFPQRDVHLLASSPVPVQVVTPAPAPAPAP